MRDTSTTPRKATLALTRAHLFALGALSVALAVMAFFVGQETGQTQVRVVETPDDRRPLVGAEARTGDLEALLATVEKNRALTPPMEFPTALPEPKVLPTPGEEPTAVGADGTVAQVAPTTPAAPTPPPENPLPDAQRLGKAVVAAAPPAAAPAVDSPVPKGGWAIEVATLPNEADAAAQATALRAKNLAAYHIVGLVDGKSIWKVRVGGYGTREAATAAVADVRARSGATAPLVTKAP
jgi:cell division septation protein DedD